MPKIKHATLTAGAVGTVALDVGTGADADKFVEVLVRSGGPVYFRTDGQTPTVAGDDCRVALTGGALEAYLEPAAISGGVGTVKLIAAAAAEVSLTVLSFQGGTK